MQVSFFVCAGMVLVYAVGDFNEFFSRKQSANIHQYFVIVMQKAEVGFSQVGYGSGFQLQRFGNLSSKADGPFCRHVD